MVRLSRVSGSLLLLGSLAFAAVPSIASAQSMPMMSPMLVQTTSTYTVVLQLGPVADMVASGSSTMSADAEVMVGQVGMSEPNMDMGASQTSSMGMSHDMSSSTGGMSSAMSNMADQGMAVNHHLEVHITDNSTGSVVSDVTPVIRVRDKSTGVSRDLNDVMAMYGAMMGPSDFHYGQNVWLPDGQYDITVMLGSQSALFRDVQVAGGEMPMSMMGH
jgi:hypothetical protein